jgi:hypothetical protein
VHACEAISQIPEIFELIENGDFLANVIYMTGSAKTDDFTKESKRRRELEAAAEAAAEDAIDAAIEAAAADAGAALKMLRLLLKSLQNE